MLASKPNCLDMNVLTLMSIRDDNQTFTKQRKEPHVTYEGDLAAASGVPYRVGRAG